MPAHRKSNQLKKLSGSKYTNEHEPTFKAHLPSCPRFLSKAARSEWRRIGPSLARAGIVTDVDRAAFALYCQSWARWIQAETEIARTGAVIEGTRTGREQVKNPWVTIASKAAEMLVKMASEFGMTPASRGRISVSPVTDSRSLAEQLFSDFIDKTPGTPGATDAPGGKV